MEDAKPLSAVDKNSFAYKTVKDRIPDILTKIIDALHRSGLDDAMGGWDVAKKIIGELSRLRSEVMTDKPLRPLDTSEADFEIWSAVMRQYIEVHGQEPTWFTAPWLYWECHLYRNIQSIVAAAGVPELDVFEKSKRKQFLDSQSAMETLAEYMEESLPADIAALEEKEIFFHKFLQVCLWGNECDLSLSGMAENAQNRDPLASLSSLASHIIADDSAKLWAHLHASAPCHLALVLDNAGFELFVDLLFADFLLRAGLVSSVAVHGKAMPWFVSDVTRRDLDWTLDQLASHRSPRLARLGQRWRALFTSGQFRFAAHAFWTTCHDFAAMERVAPELHEALGSAGLVVLKGDLNYRKLVGDRAWATTTPFTRALRGFRPAPLVSLRLCKADVVVGLGEGKAEELWREDEQWMVTGKWAVIQADV